MVVNNYIRSERAAITIVKYMLYKHKRKPALYLYCNIIIIVCLNTVLKRCCVGPVSWFIIIKIIIFITSFLLLSLFGMDTFYYLLFS